MKFILGSAVAIAASIAMSAGPALSQTPREMSVKQREIIRTVQSVDGYIDEETHREFWQSVPVELQHSKELRAQLNSLIAEVGDQRVRFMRATWLSARESLVAGRIVKTPDYIDASEKIKTASNNETFRKRALESVASAERLIASAATGQPIEVGGSKMFINADLIQQVLSGIDASEYRVGLLLKPDWNPQHKEFTYPQAHLKFLSVLPFTIEQKLITAENGKQINAVMLSQRYGKNSYMLASFVPLEGNFADPVKSLASNVRASVTGAGAVSSRPAITDWRGMQSATAFGSAQTSEGTFYVSARSVEARSLRGVFQFLVVTDLSGAEALNVRGILEDSSMILSNSTANQ